MRALPSRSQRRREAFASALDIGLKHGDIMLQDLLQIQRFFCLEHGV